MADKVIEIEDVHFSYGRQPVLTGVNLVVEEGDFIAFLGPNGGGKTTLLKLLVGVLRPDSGRIRVLGRPVRESLGSIGYIPQDLISSPGFPVSVLEVVLMGRLAAGIRGWRFNEADRQAAREALLRVGMWDRRGRLISDLSGGQRQRAFIARALVDRPRLILLDEPVASVDQEWQGRLFELLKELNREATIVVVSHDLTVVSSYIKSVACINQSLYYHPTPQITARMLRQVYHCPVELIAHGLPHRVLGEHDQGEV